MVEFLCRCQKKKSEVMLCPRCNNVYDRKVAENIERVQIASWRWNWRDTETSYIFNKRGIPKKQQQGGQGLRPNKQASFKPTSDAPKISGWGMFRGGRDLVILTTSMLVRYFLQFLSLLILDICTVCLPWTIWLINHSQSLLITFLKFLP